MDKLNEVKKSLFVNREIKIVDIDVRRNEFSLDSYWYEEVSIIIAPKKGIYDCAELQAFMEKIVPDVEYSHKENFHEAGGRLSFGGLYFDEEISGDEISLNDCRFIGLADEIILRRRTWV